MRVTVCEIPYDPASTEQAWQGLVDHCRSHRTELLVLPEFVFLEAVWEQPQFSQGRWDEIERQASGWLARLAELESSFVVGAMPTTISNKPYNQGFLWSSTSALTALRCKRYLPNEPGGWEARWFTRGSDTFPTFSAGPMQFGLNICTELWNLDSAGLYAQAGAHAIITPRATALATTERWISLAKTIAVRSGAFSLSSNRRHEDGSCGGVGWIIDPEGNELARTSAACPACTVDIDLSASERAKLGYPRYVFAGT